MTLNRLSTTDNFWRNISGSHVLLMAQHEMRLQLQALACNLGMLLQSADLPNKIAGSRRSQ